MFMIKVLNKPSLLIIRIEGQVISHVTGTSHFTKVILRVKYEEIRKPCLKFHKKEQNKSFERLYGSFVFHARPINFMKEAITALVL